MNYNNLFFAGLIILNFIWSVFRAYSTSERLESVIRYFVSSSLLIILTWFSIYCAIGATATTIEWFVNLLNS